MECLRARKKAHEAQLIIFNICCTQWIRHPLWSICEALFAQRHLCWLGHIASVPYLIPIKGFLLDAPVTCINSSDATSPAAFYYCCCAYEAVFHKDRIGKMQDARMEVVRNTDWWVTQRQVSDPWVSLIILHRAVNLRTLFKKIKANQKTQKSHI